MQAQLEYIIRQFGADTGSIHLLDGGMLVLKAHVGIPPQVAEIVAMLPVGKGMAGLAVERNQPISSCDLQVNQTGSVRPGARATGVNGAIVVPIRDVQGLACGALGIGVHAVYEYTETEIAQLLDIAARLGAEGLYEAEVGDIPT